MEAGTALERLIAGNARFRTGTSEVSEHDIPAQVSGQEPFAIILGCSDSRVPAEIIFDQGLGDLFIIRIAGNIVKPSQIGSVEFAASQFGCQLVVVLGHSHCGAVVAALNELKKGDTVASPNLAAIVDEVKPAVMPVTAQTWADEDAEIDAAVLANVARSVSELKAGSEIISDLISRGELKVIGAKYDLATGAVAFLHN